MKRRPCVLTIAGFDPSGGAGVLADIKTFEAYKSLGFAVSTGLTFQTEDSFLGVEWHREDQIKKQLDPLLKRYPIELVKIGLIENMERLNEVIEVLKNRNPGIKIIWDPVLKASAGFTFHDAIQTSELESATRHVLMITPNSEEIRQMFPQMIPEQGAEYLSRFCKVLLKGGHNVRNPGKDFLFDKGKQRTYNPVRVAPFPKHGTGCILSAAIVAGLAKGFPLDKAILNAKRYIVKVLSSNKTLLGYHY